MENKKASRKAYDWPLKLEKLSRHKTSARYACRSSPASSIDFSLWADLITDQSLCYIGDSPADLATATNSPRPKQRRRASAAFPFRPTFVEPFTFSGWLLLKAAPLL